MSDPESNERNKATVRRYVEEVWNNRNLDAIDELCDPDLVDHSDHFGTTYGTAQRKEITERLHLAFPGLFVAVHDLFGERDLVAVRATMHGAQQGEWLGVSPTGRRVDIDGVLLARLRDGKIAELWLHYDAEAMLHQMGA